MIKGVVRAVPSGVTDVVMAVVINWDDVGLLSYLVQVTSSNDKTSGMEKVVLFIYKCLDFQGKQFADHCESDCQPPVRNKHLMNGYDGNDWPMMRYADVILMLADAGADADL